jgi:sec-independent protein translocase protein TatA
MPDLGPVELLICLGIVMLIFGPSKLADLGGAMGKSIKSFRKAVEDDSPLDDDGETHAATPVSLAQQHCPACETENAASAAFCHECGASLSLMPAAGR